MSKTAGDTSLYMPEDEPFASHFATVIRAPSDKTILLLRYMDLAKLAGLLADSKLHFARADTFRDGHEGSVTDSMVAALKTQFKDKPEVLQSLSSFRLNVKESIFISCWCMGPTESEAMWRLYCGEEYGVAIAAEYQLLEDSFTPQGAIIAPVRYLDYRTQGFPQSNVIFPFFHKRLSFEHEREVRIAVWRSDQGVIGMPTEASKPPTAEEMAKYKADVTRGQQLKAERGNAISLDLDVDAVISSIFVHPDAPEWYFRVVQRVVERLTPSLAGKVLWSAMRTEPLY